MSAIAKRAFVRPSTNRGRACRGCALPANREATDCPACEPRTDSAARAAAGILRLRAGEDVKNGRWHKSTQAAQPRRLGPAGSVPEDGPAGRAGSRLVIPGVLRVRAVGPAWRLGWFGRFGRDLVGLRGRRIRGRSRRHAAWRRRRPGLGHAGISHVVPQGGPDDLPAPLRAGPVGELRPRQHLVYLRHVILGDGDPEHDGNAGCRRQPGTRHGFKVPGTARLEREPPGATTLVPIKDVGPRTSAWC